MQWCPFFPPFFFFGCPFCAYFCMTMVAQSDICCPMSLFTNLSQHSQTARNANAPTVTRPSEPRNCQEASERRTHAGRPWPVPARSSLFARPPFFLLLLPPRAAHSCHYTDSKQQLIRPQWWVGSVPPPPNPSTHQASAASQTHATATSRSHHPIHSISLSPTHYHILLSYITGVVYAGTP